MKRSFYIALALTLVFALTGCAGSGADPGDTTVDGTIGNVNGSDGIIDDNDRDDNNGLSDGNGNDLVDDNPSGNDGITNDVAGDKDTGANGNSVGNGNSSQNNNGGANNGTEGGAAGRSAG